jgi:hypothetical protein
LALKKVEMKKIIAGLLFVSFFFAACEKDDICDPATPTTPRLVLKFFNKNNVSVVRQTTDLKIIGEGVLDNKPLLNRRGETTWNDTIVYLPLRVNQNSTKYRLILNADDNDSTNDRTDILEINYIQNKVYISRACGFKSLFDLFGDPLRDPFILNNVPNVTTGNWISDIEVIQSQINDENEAHIKILF